MGQLNSVSVDPSVKRERNIFWIGSLYVPFTLKVLRPGYIEIWKIFWNFFHFTNRCKIIFWRNIFLLNILMVKIFQILILTHWLAQIMILVHWFWISDGFRTLPDQPNIRTWSATRFNFVENKQFPSIFEQCKFSLFWCYNQAVVL